MDSTVTSPQTQAPPAWQVPYLGHRAAPQLLDAAKSALEPVPPAPDLTSLNPTHQAALFRAAVIVLSAASSADVAAEGKPNGDREQADAIDQFLIRRFLSRLNQQPKHPENRVDRLTPEVAGALLRAQGCRSAVDAGLLGYQHAMHRFHLQPELVDPPRNGTVGTVGTVGRVGTVGTVDWHQHRYLSHGCTLIPAISDSWPTETVLAWLHGGYDPAGVGWLLAAGMPWCLIELWAQSEVPFRHLRLAVEAGMTLSELAPVTSGHTPSTLPTLPPVDSLAMLAALTKR